MLLTRKISPRAAPAASRSLLRLVASLARGVRRAVPTMDRRAFLRRSGLGVGVGLATAQLSLVKKAEAADPGHGREVARRSPHRVLALLGRLRGRRGGRERRLDPPGAGVRFAAQPRRALRQGRGAARARPRRIPAQDADEAGRQQVRADLVGPGAERDQRQDARSQEAERPRLDLRRRLVEAQQRAGLPAAQVDEPVGQQQLRPPGAHLPLHHGRGRREHVGLRRDDEFVQRHAQLQVRDVHRLERRRGASGLDAAHAARQGNRLQDDRRRSALHAHRGQGRRVRADPLRLGHRLPVRPRSTTSSRTAGKTRSTSPTASTAWTRSRKR